MELPHMATQRSSKRVVTNERAIDRYQNRILTYFTLARFTRENIGAIATIRTHPARYLTEAARTPKWNTHSCA
jgi:hypothetical protein